MKYCGLLWVLFAWLGLLAVANAQGTPEVQIGSVMASCKDSKGNVVMNHVAPTATGAVAGMDGAGPVITVDPAFAEPAKWHFHVFVYLHECGHHVLGHAPGTSVQTRDRELAADCYAARMSKSTGWLNESDFAVAMSQIAAPANAPADPPGSLRMVNALACRIRG